MNRTATRLGTPNRAVDRLRRDLALALRSLRRTPGFTIAAVAILGLGIGMSTAMFTVYRTVLVERLPVLDQNRLVVMHPLDRGGTHIDPPMSYLKEIARDSGTMRAVAGVYHLGAVSIPLLDGSRSLPLNDAIVTPDFFDVLGTRPLLGRLFRPSDGAVGAPSVIVLSFQTWRRVFNEDSLIVGHRLVNPYDGTPVTIVGVALPGLEYPSGADFWAAAHTDFALQVDVLARLAPGASTESARAQFYAILQRTNPFAGEKLPGLPKLSGVDTKPFTNEVLGGAPPVIVVLMLAVLLLLVIACVNVGNLVLVRAVGRAREIAVRRAIGASAGDIVHQLVVENAAIAVAGGIVGLVVAQLLLRATSLLAPVQLPRLDDIRVAGAPLAAAAAATLVTILLFGIFPSLAAARSAPYAVLRSDARAGSEGAARRRTRRWLVSSQVALALVMLAGAALLARSLERLQGIDLGYTPENVSLVSITGPQSVFPTRESQPEIGERVVKRLESLPGVVAATIVESVPFKGESFFIMKMARADQSVADGAANPYIPFEVGTTDYFRTFQIPIVQGRGFLETDTKESEQIVVLSESLARRFWPAESAVGKKLRNVYDTTGALATVVGVAGDTHFRTLRGVAPVIYVPSRQMTPFWNGFVAVRTRGPLATALPSIRDAVHDVNPQLVVWKTETMDGLLAGPLAQPRLSALLLSSFSVVALLLAAIGLYGVMSSIVRQGTRDIGICMALGATAGDVRRFVLREAMRVVLAGAAVGLVFALLGTRLLASLLYDVSPADPLALGAASALLVTIAACAAYVPARYAARIDPAVALRAE